MAYAAGECLTGTLSLILSIKERCDGSLAITVHPTQSGSMLNVNASVLELSVWMEGGDIVRARLCDQRSGQRYYMQGNNTAFALAHVIGLKLTSPP